MQYIFQRGTALWLILMIGLLLIAPLPHIAQSQDPVPPRIESNDPRVVQSGQWTSQAAADASGGSYLYNAPVAVGTQHVASVPDAVLQLEFSGPSIEVLYVAGPTLGTLAINVDDTVLRTVITTADQTAYQQSARIDYLSDEAHTLKVYAQEGGVVAIDAFVVPTSPPDPLSASSEGEADGQARVPFCAPTNVIHRVSLTSTGEQVTTDSYMGSMSNDGRYVTFFSSSPLVPADTNTRYDVYVYDRQTCTVELISVSLTGVAGNGMSAESILSGDGRHVVFWSRADDLVSDDTNAVEDIFVYDRTTHTMSRVSVASDGSQGNGFVWHWPAISTDGLYVAFASSASNLVPNDTNGHMDVFVHDLTTHTTTRVSVASDGSQSSGGTHPEMGGMSADGRFVAFSSDAPNLVANDTNNTYDLFVHDRQTGQTSRVSVATGGTQANGPTNWSGSSSGGGSFSGDGRFIVFSSMATNLVANDTNGVSDVFVHDRNTNTTIRVSVASDGSQANADSSIETISADGRYVGYESAATNLVPGDTNGGDDAFVYDRNTGITTRVSVTANGAQAQGATTTYVDISLSSDGSLIAFQSTSPNLISGDTNGVQDVFVVPLNPVFVPSSLTATPLDDGRIQLNWIDNASDETEFRIERSPDGLNNWMEIGTAPANTTTYTNVSLICNTTYHYRVRAYRASDMTYSAYSNVANATTAACPTSCAPIYGIARVSVSNGGGQGNGYSLYSDLSSDGRYIAFSSGSSNLVPNDTNNADDTFVRDNVTCQIWRVSVSSSGTEQNLYPNTDFVSISADGRYVAFKSGSSNLVPNDTNGFIDIFVHDRLLGQTRRVSIANDGTQSNGFSNNPIIAAGGRYVLFNSNATNLVPNDTNGLYDLFYYDLQTNTLARVAISGFTGGVMLGSYMDLSSDGRYIVFSSPLNTVVAGDTNNVNDVFLYDRDTTQVTRISQGMGGAQSNGHSTAPSISDDGRYVTYSSNATNLAPNDTNGYGDIFVYDRQTGQTTRVSVSSTGQQNNASSEMPVISGNGRYVTFVTEGNTLVPGDTNDCAFGVGCVDVFLHDRQTGQTVRLSDSNMGEQGNDRSLWPSISGDGHYVGFYALATNLVEGDTNGQVDVMMVNTNRALASDALAIVNPATRSANLVHTLTNPPAPSDYTQFATGFPYGTGGQYLTGDWNGDGLETLGVYRGGAFFFTNDYGTGGTWGGVWFGLGGQPVAGRFDANVGHDCLGVTDSGTWTNGDTYFALYFTCDLTSGPTPPLTFQWLSILLPNSVGFTGTFQFVAGDFDGDGVDSIAVRRGNFIAWTNVPPTTVNSAFQYAQYIGAPGTGDEGKVVVGDWDLNTIDSFGLVYQNGQFYRRNDVEWNTGVYIFQQFTPLVGTPFDVASWRPN